MRFLSLIRVAENTGQKPSEKLMADMGRLIAETTADGTLLGTAGLRPTSEGKRMRLSCGKRTVSDGPFTESKEVIGGYALLKAESMERVATDAALPGRAWRRVGSRMRTAANRRALLGNL